MAGVTNTPALKAMLTENVGVGGRLNAVKVMLFQNDITPSKQTLLADLVEATFDGYARSAAVTWGTVGQTSTGAAEVYGDTKLFTSSGDTTPNTIYGFALVNTGGTAVEYAERFASPIPVSQTGITVPVTPRYTRDSDVS